MKKLPVAFVATAFTLGSAVVIADDTGLECVMSSKVAGVRVFSTSDVWTILQLDTETGRLWQVQLIHADEPRGQVTVNGKALADSGKRGPFTLCPTGSMRTYIIVDQETGRTWQARIGTKDDERGVTEIDPKSATGYMLLPPIN